MNAVRRKVLADMKRNRIQTAVVAFVVFLSSLAATLALTLLVESDAPFDRAFEQVQGPHLTIFFDAAAVSDADARATGSLPQVTAFGGPWKVVPVVVDRGARTFIVPTAERDRFDGPVDRLTLARGRWLQATDEVVLSQRTADELRLGVGDTLTPSAEMHMASLRVVGIATAVADPTAAWTLPGQLPVVTSAKVGPSYLTVYRLRDAGTVADITSVADAISASLPPQAVLSTSNYLQIKSDADKTTAVMIPFLLAFSAFALLASALIIANLVGGAVIAGSREIGIMKSVGFTPTQVVAVFAGQMLIPAAVGCLLGLPIGVLLSQPFLTDTAHAFGLPQTFAVAPVVDLVGLGAILGIVTATAVLASLRAGRLSAAAAIAIGSSPSSGGGARAARFARGLPLPRAMTLGLGDSFARPIRSAMTVLAIVIGLSTVAFAWGLSQSLDLVASALTRDHQVQASVFRTSRGAAATSTDQETEALIKAHPDTVRLVAERVVDLTIPGLGAAVPLTVYRGDSAWLGYVLINGRWFSGPGEAVAPTAFFTRTGKHLGDRVTASFNGQPIAFVLVGEIFDQEGDNVILRADVASLPGTPNASSYEVQLRAGTNAEQFARTIRATGSGLEADANGSRLETPFNLIKSVLAGLAAVLTLIAICGVFNTVLLNAREKARDIAILKAVGMSPRQVVAMVLSSVAALGVIGATLGLPTGQVLHRYILTLMGQIATATAIPASFFDVFGPGLIATLAIVGIAVALLGAAVPSQWAARARVTEVLQTE